MQFTIARTLPELRSALDPLWPEGIAFIPTMGALHAGHMSLVEASRQYAPHAVASVFVNPAQFGPNEDFARYPRALESDAAMLEAAGVRVLYAPEVEDIYPPGFATMVGVQGALVDELEGAHRPGHFAGVATVVAKLLMRVMPRAAVFGEKDWQQLCVIRRMALDLDLPAHIASVPTLREADGLAMSSRNRYLSEAERAIAPLLYQMLKEIAAWLASPAPRNEDILSGAAQHLLASGFTQVDYIALRDAETLGSPQPSRPMRLLAAAWLGHTRLIDNVAVSG